MCWLAGFLVVVVGVNNAGLLSYQDPLESQENTLLSPHALLSSGNARTSTRCAKLNSLDTPIIRLSRRRDFIRRRDIVRNVAIRGSIGSGKTSGPFELIERACWEAGDFGLILSAKNDSAQKAIQIIRAAGRENSLVHITPSSGHWFDPVDFAMRQGGGLFPLDEALDEVWTMLEIINRGEVATQGDNFFVPAQKELIHKAMKVAHRAKGKVDLRDLVKICERLPDGFDALDNPERYYVLQLIELARMRCPEGRDEQLDRAIAYFTKTIPGLSDRTRSSIAISATVRLGALLEPIYDMLFKHATNITPADIIDKRLLVVLDVPVSMYGSAARAIGVAWKQALQKELMRRHYNEDRPLCGIWADEAACWLTEKMDVEATERGRSAGMYHVYTYQSHSTIVNGYGGGAVGEARANALLSNFNVHIMCGQTDSSTRLNDQKMIGNVPTVVTTIGENWKHENLGGGDRDGGGASESHTTQWLPSLPEEWLLGLESGQRGYVDAFVFVGGIRFNWNEKRWLLVQWPQNYSGWRWMEAQGEKVPWARPFFGYISPRDLWEAFKRRDWEEFYRWANFWTEGQMFWDKPGGGGSHV